MFNNVNIVKGDTLACKYPKHGRRNILKRHEGVVENLGVSKNGLYATIRSEDNTVRTLSFSKMIDPQKV
ncbi:MAG: hypothetical protein FI729_03440 [SAR202 cluster bacterium]|jgi:hypothetical protein|nr:hypothetical protein [SAR202 cluster bacterium]|tara:strand:- start:1902 stop:2108 length:207 start_codon:yes stop_codon:yes gene_type:complete